MRGTEREQPGLFSYVALEDRIPADHPLRTIRRGVDRVGWMVTFATGVYNLVRMRTLLPAPA